MPLSPPFALRPCLALLLLSPSLALAGNAVPLTPTTITATRTEQAVDSVPSTVSVQTREQLDRQNVNNIKELVRYEPGVSVGGAGQRAGITGYNIRGIDGNRILTQIDGVELPNDFFSGPYAQTHRNYVDPDIVKRVEILRGPASALYGSNAIGGAVSYFTLDPSDIIKDGKDVGARLKAGYESASHSWLTSATVAGRADDFDGLLHYGYRQGHETESNGGHGGTGLSRSEANPEDADSYSLLGKLGWNYAEGSRFGLVFEKYKSDVDTDQKSAYGGPYDKGKPAIPPSMLPGGMYQWRKGNDTLTRERYGLEHHFLLDSQVADRIQWSLNYQLAKTDQATREFYYPITRKVLRTRDTTYKERLWVFDSQLDKSFAIGETEHLLSYGINLKHQKVTGMRSGTGTNLDTGADSPRDALERSSDFPDPTVKTYALFAQDSISWNDWTFTPGLRYDYTRMEPHITDEFLRTMKQSQNTAVDESDKKWHRVSPKFGVTYDFAQHYTWYGQYAQGFRTPTAKALYGRFENLQAGYHIEPNPNLKPEKSQSFETGLRGKFDEGSFGVAVFYNKYRDFIDEDALNTDSTGGNGQTFQSNNIERAVIKGVGSRAAWSWAPSARRRDSTPRAAWPTPTVATRTTASRSTASTHSPECSAWATTKQTATTAGCSAGPWSNARIASTTAPSTPDGTASVQDPGLRRPRPQRLLQAEQGPDPQRRSLQPDRQKYWLWDDVRGYDSVGEASALAPANIDRLSQPGRNFAVNLVWDI